MSYSLQKYYDRDIPAYMMEEIIAGMIDGKPEPTPEEMKSGLPGNVSAKPRHSSSSTAEKQSGLSPALSFCSEDQNQYLLALSHAAQPTNPPPWPGAGTGNRRYLN